MFALLLLIALVSYAAGSIPFGYLVARIVGRVDIRRQGSGNIGATNVGRALGFHWGVLVLVLDALKGFIPVWGLVRLTDGWLGGAATLPWYAQPAQRAALAGVAAIAGHLWPFMLGLRGGKGVATALGVMTGITVLSAELMAGPVVLGVAVWILVVLVARYASLASVLASLAFSACYLGTVPQAFQSQRLGMTLLSLAIAPLVAWRHRSNLVRLLRGQEPRLGDPIMERGETAGHDETGDRQPGVEVPTPRP